MDSTMAALKRLMLTDLEKSSSCHSIYYHVECEKWLKNELLPVVQEIVGWQSVNETVLKQKITLSEEDFNGVTLVVISAACVDDDDFWHLVEVARRSLKDALLLVTYDISESVLLATPERLKLKGVNSRSLLANSDSNFTVELKRLLFEFVQSPQKHKDATGKGILQREIDKASSVLPSRCSVHMRRPREFTEDNCYKILEATRTKENATTSMHSERGQPRGVHSGFDERCLSRSLCDAYISSDDDSFDLDYTEEDWTYTPGDDYGPDPRPRLRPTGLAVQHVVRRPKLRLLKIVYEENNTYTKQVRQRQVFIYYHDDDKDWVRNVLIVYLHETLKMSIKTEEHFELGSVWIEDILQVIETSEFIIVVLSTSYVKDGKCCQVTVRAYNMRPYGLIPVALPGITKDVLTDKDGIFRVIVETFGLILWSHTKKEQDTFWAELTSRLSNDQTAEETLSEVVEAVGNCMTPPQDVTAAYERKSDVFIHYHNDDFDWVHDVLTTYVTKTLRMTVKTEDQFNYGSCRETEILQSVLTSEFTIVVVSISFVFDREYSALTAKFYAIRPLNLILVATPGITAEVLARNSFFSELSQIKRLIHWSEDRTEQATFWTKLTHCLCVDQSSNC